MGKRLSDLYARGKPAAFSETDSSGSVVGDPVVVYLAKISPVQQEEAARAGNARQAVVLSADRDHTSQMWLAVEGRAAMKPDEELIERLVAEHTARRQPVCENRVAFEDEWHKDGYLTGLKDAWARDIQKRFVTDPTDEEAAHVHAELQRYTAAVDSDLAAEVNPLRRELDELPQDKLRSRWCEEELKLRGLVSFNIEYFKHCLVASVREPCPTCADAVASGEKHVGAHSEPYFSSPEEVDGLDINIRAQLQAAYSDMTVSSTEGKGSPPVAASLPSSVPADQVATDASSGPTDVPA